jgi:ABC-type uncharacterized transport system permease subunit
MSLRENPVGTILKLLLLCLVVGLVLTFFDITPQHIFSDTLRTIGQVWDLVERLLRWAVPYIMMGAIVVVPIVVISQVLRARR